MTSPATEEAAVGIVDEIVHGADEHVSLMSTESPERSNSPERGRSALPAIRGSGGGIVRERRNHGGRLHSLNHVNSPWQNPWHTEPPRWRALRGTTVTDSDIANHKAQASDHAAEHQKQHTAKLEEQAEEKAARAVERKNYNGLNFISRAYHASKPHLRAKDPLSKG